MKLDRKKIVFVLVAIIFVGAALALRGGENTARVQTSEMSSGISASKPGFATTSAQEYTNQELFHKMLWSVFLVVILGAAAIYISKKFLPKITNLPGKRIKVLETAYLGQRKAIHLVSVDGRCLVVGSTNESITKLAEVGDELIEQQFNSCECLNER